jgi:glycosyltransferase involved in cell wall biosynthesis
LKLRSLDIVLPTIDENENLELLIPDLFDSCESLLKQIIIVDDSSQTVKDKLKIIVKKYGSKVVLISNKNPKGSLAAAILSGIQHSKSEFVLWMDADLSMPAKVVPQLCQTMSSPDQVVIGSRFCSGGGFKGALKHGDNFSYSWLLQIKNTNDSVLAIILSRLLNSAIRIIIGQGIRDYTSGFVLCNRNTALQLMPLSGYGEYSIKFMVNALKKNLKIVEIGYICVPRKFGQTKTGTTLPQLVRRGIPYLRIALLSNRFSIKKFRLIQGEKN